MNDKAKHALRIVIGLYLAYLGWQLFDAVVIKGTGNKLMGAFLGPVFLIVGLLYAGNSIRKVLALRKEEQYGTPDSDEDTVEDDIEGSIEVKVESDTDNNNIHAETISSDADSVTEITDSDEALETEEAVEEVDGEER